MRPEVSLLLGSLILALAPQSPAPAPAPAAAPAAAGPVLAVFRGVLGDHGVDVTRLGLGSGGIGPARREAHADAHDGYLTRAGVLVRARPEGVKFDFPSGTDFVVDTKAVIRLRSGEATPPHHNGVLIALADGTVVEIVPHGRDGDPLRHVEVRDGARRIALWRQGAVLTWSQEARAAREIPLFALGDGRMLYRGGALGPIVAFERLLAPRDAESTSPEQCVAIVGDVLGRSLVDLAMAASRRLAGEIPLVRRANGLAIAAPRLFLFGEPLQRPPGATGELLVPIDAGAHLAITSRSGGELALDLWVRGADTPECEWIVGTRTLLHLLVRDDTGKLRFAMQGVDLREHVDDLLPIETGSSGAALVRRLIGERARADRTAPLAPTR